jgi:hypothetical protein
VVPHVEPGVLTERIKADEGEKKACQWRLDHIPGYAAGNGVPFCWQTVPALGRAPVCR